MTSDGSDSEWSWTHLDEPLAAPAHQMAPPPRQIARAPIPQPALPAPRQITLPARTARRQYRFLADPEDDKHVWSFLVAHPTPTPSQLSKHLQARSTAAAAAPTTGSNSAPTRSGRAPTQNRTAARSASAPPHHRKHNAPTSTTAPALCPADAWAPAFAWEGVCLVL
jgi:hypothetical protein